MHAYARLACFVRCSEIVLLRLFLMRSSFSGRTLALSRSPLHSAALFSGPRRRCSTSNAGPPPSANTGTSSREADLQKLVAGMERDPELIRMVVNNMSPESRRRLVLTGGAYEWFGKDSIASEMQRADVENDHKICPKDFDNWFEGALRRKTAQAQQKAGGATTASGSEASKASSAKESAKETDAKQDESGNRAQGGDASSNSSSNSAKIGFGALLLVALEAGLPFVGFGFLDNATMILAGDAIDRTVGFYLNCSVMASAAMGNVVSGCMGMQVHGFVEKLVQRLNLPIPPLTVAQRRSQRVFLAGHIGGTIGIATGLTLGLVPLLFITDEDEKADQRVFHSMDRSERAHV